MKNFYNKKVVILIILYNPTQSQVQRINELAKKENCIVVDNSDYKNDKIDNSKIDYIPLLKNTGIARAQQIGVQEAINIGFQYICFFDQDTHIPNDYIYNMIYHFENIKSNLDPKVGMIGPTVINAESNKEYNNHANKLQLYNHSPFIISSGSLISLDLFTNYKLIDENLFIDLVDHDTCFRLQYAGYNIYTVRDVFIKHSIGTSVTSFLGQELVLSAPFRYYYQYRNTLYLIRRNYVPLIWKFKTFLMMFSRIPYMALSPFYNKSRKEILKYTWKGIWHGLFNKQKINL